MDFILSGLSSLRDLMSAYGLFSVGMLLIAGYFLGKLAGLIRLPEITGYIVAGILLGDSVSGVVHEDMSDTLRVITDVALGLIALTVGGEFALSKLRRIGREVVLLTVVQILMTLAATSIALWAFRLPLPYSLMLGAIATATDAVATVAIVQSLRAHGPFIDRLYGLVALDDAGAVIIFGIVFAVVAGILGSEAAESVTASGAGVHGFLVVLHAFQEILLSIFIGAVVGWIIHALSWKKTHSGELVIIALGWIFILTAVCMVFHLSPLLSNMAAGTVLMNMSPRNRRIFHLLEPITPPIYALFFAIAGTELNPQILLKREILILGSVFILSRGFGKVFGVLTGAIMAKSQANVRKYLGFCMIPQAGVSIGLVLLIQASALFANLPAGQKEIVGVMVNIILLSVFFNELVGPPISKVALVKALDEEQRQSQEARQ